MKDTGMRMVEAIETVKELRDKTSDLIEVLDNIPASELGSYFKGECLSELGRMLARWDRLSRNLKRVENGEPLE